VTNFATADEGNPVFVQSKGESPAEAAAASSVLQMLGSEQPPEPEPEPALGLGPRMPGPEAGPPLYETVPEPLPEKETVPTLVPLPNETGPAPPAWIPRSGLTSLGGGWPPHAATHTSATAANRMELFMIISFGCTKMRASL
jgi:hypothetical protein